MADSSAKIAIDVPKDIPVDHPAKLRKWLRLKIISCIYNDLSIVMPYESMCFFFSLLSRKAVPHDPEFYKIFITRYMNAIPAKAETFAKEVFYTRDIYDRHRRAGTLPDGYNDVLAMEDALVAKYRRPHKVSRFQDMRDRVPFMIPQESVHFFQRGLLPILRLSNVPRELNNVREIGDEFSKFGDLVRVTTDQDTQQAEIVFSQPLAVIMSVRYYQHGVTEDNRFKAVHLATFVDRRQLDQEHKVDVVLEGCKVLDSSAMTSTPASDASLRDPAALREYARTVKAEMESSTVTTELGDSASPKRKSVSERSTIDKRDKKSIVVTNIPDQYHGINFFQTNLITKREAVKSIQEGSGKLGEYCLHIEMHTAPAAIGLLKTINSQKDKFDSIDASFAPVDFELMNSQTIPLTK